VDATRGKWVAITMMGVGAAAAALPVLAQTADLQEVVVTARKREESFKDVPITMNVITDQTIQQAGIENTRDYVAMIPNMTLVETQNAGNAFITVRGISQARNSEPSVAVLVDGVLESNPYEFDQELFDIQQIEVLKGPQGALYGRDAIGGAIIIRTKDPADKLEAQTRLGVGNGTSERVQGMVSGPLGDSGTFKYRASLNFYNTDGFLENVYLHDKADPLRDYSGRLRVLWKPSDAVTGDFRVYIDRLETRAYYFVVARADESNPFSIESDANNVTAPIQVNNTGEDNRDIWDVAYKFDYDTGHGTLTSITNWNRTREIDTGDAFDFRPIATSYFKIAPAFAGGLGFDLNQSQYIDVKAESEELRYTSQAIGGFSWIGGAYFVHTERFISTGNMVDEGLGVFPVYQEPRLTGTNPSATFLADSQNNNAWALFANATYEFNKQWEFDAALRYDEDSRANTTRTPAGPFLDELLDPTARSGEVRKHTWDEVQPKATLRYRPTDEITLYGGWSRGFRSGGFNQTGVGINALRSGIYGVSDLFNAEVADTYEVGVKGEFLERRLNAGLSVYHTKSTNGYFFVFLASNSTQNLGNLDATYKGVEFELNAKPTDRIDLYANFGYTDSHIDRLENINQADPAAVAASAAVVGNQAPLVSRMTTNVGAQYRQPLPSELSATIRVDYQNIGRTWWDPQNDTSRDPVSLVNLRLGLQSEKWSVAAWSKNLTNKLYNAEFSPGGFLWRAPPRTYGVDFDYHF
jgi:iron complex outermembrane recepter protein